MNFGNASFMVSTPTAPPEPPREAPRPDPNHPDDSVRQEREFERALRDELDRKAGVKLPLPLPWMAQQAQTGPTEKEQGIEAAGAANALVGNASRSAAAWLRSPLTPMPTNAAPVPVLDAPEVAPIQPTTEGPVTEVQVMVEAHLPIIQPLQPAVPETKHLHVADFPQMVTGTAQQMVKDNKPLTQLDFQISPPHIGPVNLTIQLQNGAVNVQVLAQSLQAKQALEGQINSITSILQAHSFTPGQIKIVTAASGKAGAGSAGQKGDQSAFNLFQGGRRRPSADQDSATVGKA